MIGPGSFIRLPRFAMVIAIVMVIAGALAMTQIPVTQFPPITPPEIQVSASYPGANANVMAESVGALIEEQVNGVEGMLYMSSSSTNNGTYSLTVTFAVGTDPEIAQINVQNRVATATPRLPAVVSQTGVTVRSRSSSMLMGVAVYSPKGTKDALFVSNYASINIRDALARISGVGDAGVFGPAYSMRIWMNPDRMEALGVTAADLGAAIQAQNAQASAGQIGSPPISDGQQLQLTILAKGRLSDPSEFGNIVVRTNSDGAIVRLRDVARVELGAQSYDTVSTFNGRPSATIVLYQSADANALSVSQAARAELERLQQQFPEDIAYTVVFDTTSFLNATIQEIIITLAITFVLVVAVVYVFLQDWRATILPTLTIPVSLIGAFTVLYFIGYSANTITLFAMVLAISLVVDDAIIVAENAQRVMQEEGLSITDATLRTMEQVTGPIIATTLVLAALFVPVSFLPGITGQLYRQFAVTILVTISFSTINALTLSPALCAMLLKPPPAKRAKVFERFNSSLGWIRDFYIRMLLALSTRFAVSILVILGIFAGTYALVRVLPTGFIPSEDQGYLFTNVQLPNAAAIGRTEQAVAQVQTILRNTPGVENVIGISGMSLIGGGGSNAGMVIAALKPWSERGPDESADAILQKLRGDFTVFSNASVVAFNPPRYLDWAPPAVSISGCRRAMGSSRTSLVRLCAAS